MIFLARRAAHIYAAQLGLVLIFFSACRLISRHNGSMLQRVKKRMFIAFGLVFVAVAVVGIFVPLLPTTPFLLLAAYCFSNGSEKLHQWLLSHPRLGPPLHDWEDHRVIRPRAKALAVTLILASMSYPVFFMSRVPQVGKIGLACLAIVLVAFILTRNSSPRK